MTIMEYLKAARRELPASYRISYQDPRNLDLFAPARSAFESARGGHLLAMKPATIEGIDALVERARRHCDTGD